MISIGHQNIYATANINLEQVNPLWAEVDPLPLRETLAEYGHSIPAIDVAAKAAYLNPEEVVKLMLENDAIQVRDYLRSAGINIPPNPTLTLLLDTALQKEKKRPGFILELWNRFNPLVTEGNKTKRATRLIKSFDFWASDVPEKFLQKTIQLRNEAFK